MPTTVHIPPKILKSVDRRARALKVSRNRFIVEALERRLSENTDAPRWSDGFLGSLEARGKSAEYRRAVNQLFDEVAKARKSKRIVDL